jgi:hypothetical protein
MVGTFLIFSKHSLSAGYCETAKNRRVSLTEAAFFNEHAK